MELRPWQQEALDGLREYAEQAIGGKTLMLRSILRESGKHKLLMEHVRREHARDTISFVGSDWPAICVYDEISVDDAYVDFRHNQKFRLEKFRGAINSGHTLIDIKDWLKQSVFTLNKVQRPPQIMTVDDWHALSPYDVYLKAAYGQYYSRMAGINRLLTIYWHNYYMYDLQSTLSDGILQSLAFSDKVEAYELFNAVPRLTYVRTCIAQYVVFGADYYASTIS